MINKIKLTKQSKKNILDQHLGTGTIVYKSAENEISYINFYIGRNDGKIRNSGTGDIIEKINM